MRSKPSRSLGIVSWGLDVPGDTVIQHSFGLLKSFLHWPLTLRSFCQHLRQNNQNIYLSWITLSHSILHIWNCRILQKKLRVSSTRPSRETSNKLRVAGLWLRLSLDVRAKWAPLLEKLCRWWFVHYDKHWVAKKSSGKRSQTCWGFCTRTRDGPPM